MLALPRTARDLARLVKPDPFLHVAARRCRSHGLRDFAIALCDALGSSYQQSVAYITHTARSASALRRSSASRAASSSRLTRSTLSWLYTFQLSTEHCRRPHPLTSSWATSAVPLCGQRRGWADILARVIDGGERGSREMVMRVRGVRRREPGDESASEMQEMRWREGDVRRDQISREDVTETGQEPGTQRRNTSTAEEPGRL